ncbi:MAG TPA: TetR/AcrR family transcriptional regulator [Solirubrobacteraceae bacterium]|nr:TetR/AcrR family transcriptional regulator [Solirubrobacteraceae bacterium]
MSETQPRRRGRPPGDGREAILEATGDLLRERGISRLTTREVAARAGVSEASVFYHYGDRAKLLQAAFDRGLAPLLAIAAQGEVAGADRHQVLERVGRGIERFLMEAMPILTAAQSDAELRDELAAMMSERDLGPHRGVSRVGDYLAAEQAAGRVRGDVDPHAVAASFVGTCVMRAFQATMHLPTRRLPPLSAVIDALDTMLEPPPG